ncbi:MAG: flagellar export chaperone FliS [Porticoccaceae bacterium]|jgi:flagellar protein FliS|nr:flagellar export chaperone FliS [Porticoccaceae bacterium]MBT6115676.1 flagellar export chaperone FliS [Porticoccaceae bacterium]MBT6592661.1 flagellar export chaperone FliS [Porticoccaceae bacterium]MDG1078793.1 flagellar export chaperone FliS [Porticoccaceae bacterium]MDG1495933.1 flagellar export chaperone FliS [Porticoccaceae bacterium]
MALNSKALNAYHNVHIASAVPYADGVQLIQMLFDGLVDALATAEGEIERKNIQEKCRALNRATSILYGLQDSLDFKKGSDLARNLSDLYEYMIRRVMFANLHNDVNALHEVKGLISEIRSAWALLPSLLKEQPIAMAS